MAFNFTLPLRAAQAFLAILILGLTAYDVSNWAPSETNFLLFCSVWTLLAVAYLVVTPGRYPTAAHKYGILAAEVLTMIFWFAGFIAEAVLLTDTGCRRGSVCRSMQAATVFAAFEWSVEPHNHLVVGELIRTAGFSSPPPQSWPAYTSGGHGIASTNGRILRCRSIPASRFPAPPYPKRSHNLFSEFLTPN